MPMRIRFEHQTLSSGQHAVTSPDVKGFCIVAATPEGAIGQAVEMLILIWRRRAGVVQERIAAVEFEAA